MATKKQTWVSPRWNDWIVQHENSQRASRVFDTQKEAIEYWRNLSQNMKTEFHVQRKDGTVRIKDSHWNDPYDIIW